MKLGRNRNFKAEIIGYFSQLLLAFIFSRVVVEWYLLSRFQTQYTYLYKFMWTNSGYLASGLFIFWFLRWQTTSDTIIIECRKRSNHKSISGKSFLLLLVFYIFTILSIFLFYLFFSINMFSTPLDIVLNYQEALNLIYTTFTDKFYLLVITGLILLVPNVTKVLDISMNLSFILINGLVWSNSDIFPLNINSSLFSSSKASDLNTFIVVISLFVVFKILIQLLKAHLFNNGLSDWVSGVVSGKEKKHIVYAFYSLFVLLVFCLGIYV